MALNAAILFEIRQGGSDANGGGFKAGASGTDYTLQDAAQYTSTTAQTQGTSVILLSTAAAVMVGNVAYVQGGTGAVAANWYEITAVSVGVSITVDRSTGLTAGTGVTVNIGGAFATPGVLTSVSGGIGGVLVTGQKAWAKYNATAMNCSTSTAGPAGPCNLPSGILFVLEGYDVTRGDRTGNRPTYKWTASAPGGITYLFAPVGGNRQHLANLQADGNAVNNVGGFNLAVVRLSIVDCVVIGCTGTAAIGINVNSAVCEHCQTISAVTGIVVTSSSAGASVADCDVSGGTTGISVAGTGGGVTDCLVRASGTGFTNASNVGFFRRCTADSCTVKGFNDGGIAMFINCLATNNAGVIGYSVGSGSIMLNCGYYNNGTHVSGTPAVNSGLIALTADPYVNQAGADFRPNATAGGGAALRAAGIGVFGQTDSQDVGALQHTDPSASTSVFSGEF